MYLGQRRASWIPSVASSSLVLAAWMWDIVLHMRCISTILPVGGFPHNLKDSDDAETLSLTEKIECWSSWIDVLRGQMTSSGEVNRKLRVTALAAPRERLKAEKHHVM